MYSGQQFAILQCFFNWGLGINDWGKIKHISYQYQKRCFFLHLINPKSPNLKPSNPNWAFYPQLAILSVSSLVVMLMAGFCMLMKLLLLSIQPTKLGLPYCHHNLSQGVFISNVQELAKESHPHKKAVELQTSSVRGEAHWANSTA